MACALQATENKLVLKYGQDLYMVAAYDKNDKLFSETRFTFEEDLLKSAIVTTATEIHTYNYTQEADNNIEEYIFAEKDSGTGISTNQTRKIIEQSPDKNAEYNYIWKNNSWLKLNGTIYSYSNKMQTSFEEVKGIDNEWDVIRRVEYFYYTAKENAMLAGKLKKVHSFVNEEISSKTDYSYILINDAICLQSETVYGVNSVGSFQKCMQTDYAYPSNNQDHVVLEISYYDLATNALVGRDKHTSLKKSGTQDAYQIQVFDGKNIPVRLIKKDYSYQNNNYTVEEKSSVSDLLVAGTENVHSRLSTTFTGNNPVRAMQEIFSEEKWNKKEELLAAYNSEGYLIKKEAIKYSAADAAGISMYKTEWTYDPAAKVDRFTTYAYDELSSQMIKVWSFAVSYGDTYPTIDNKSTEIKPKNSFFIYPNPASENIYISENFDFSSPIQYFIYNLTGKLQKKGFVYSSQEAISVAELPAGNYVFRLAKDGEYASCVFIKL